MNSMNATTYTTLPEALEFFTAFQIGFDLLPPPGKVNADTLLTAFQKNPMNQMDILLSGLTEIAESMPPKDAVKQILGTLYGAAALLDVEKTKRGFRI